MIQPDRRELFARAADEKTIELQQAIILAYQEGKPLLAEVLYTEAAFMDGYAKGLRARVEGDTVSTTFHHGDHLELKLYLPLIRKPIKIGVDDIKNPQYESELGLSQNALWHR